MRKYKRSLAFVLVLGLMAGLIFSCGAEASEPLVGKVTLMELGSDWCLPCKMMGPILDELQKKYPKDLKVVIVDVQKDKQAAIKYQVKVIPTQIFFDREGKEVKRHVGFMPEKEILNVLNELKVSQ